MSRALHGDLVAVEILPEDSWKVLQARSESNMTEAEAVSSAEEVTIEPQDSDMLNKLWRPQIACANGDEGGSSYEAAVLQAARLYEPKVQLDPAAFRNLERINNTLMEKSQTNKMRATGKVVTILKRGHNRKVVGVLERQVELSTDTGDGLTDCVQESRYQMIPRDRRNPFIYILERDVPKHIVSLSDEGSVVFVHTSVCSLPAELRNTLVFARVSTWSRSNRFPLGGTVTAVGDMDDIESETKAILMVCWALPF